MQIKLFTIPVGDDGRALQEMNAFLRSHKILEVEDHFVSNENGSYWCFCVRYVERAFELTNEKKPGTKTDYRELLSEAVFQKFSKLREIRKQAAANEGVSTFVICTDEELAEMAKLEEITPAALLSIKGIGDKKYELHLHNDLWSQKEFQRHVTPLVAFTQHAEALAFRQKVQINLNPTQKPG